MNEIIEIVSVVLAICYTYLATRENIWCWPFGIVSSILGIYLFIHAKIYAEAILFTYYVVIGFYGWFSWSNSGKKSVSRTIGQWRLSLHLVVLGLGYILSILLGYTLAIGTDAELPYLDAFTTIFSFIATWMMARRIIENWIYWIAIDALAIYLYASRNLDYYAQLSFVYSILAIYGYWNWKKSMVKLQVA